MKRDANLRLIEGGKFDAWSVQIDVEFDGEVVSVMTRSKDSG